MQKLLRPGLALAVLALGLAAVAPASSAEQAEPQDEAQEIVVTARRIGIPVWRVTGPKTSIILIGSIGNVAKGTRWDPAALATTLQRGDRVMFPDLTGVAISPFSMMGHYLKWRRMATLPKGQTLAAMLPPEQYRRLLALRSRGVLKAGFERTHPLHLAIALRKSAEKNVGFGPGINQHVRRAVKQHKLKLVPIRTVKAKGIVKDFWATPATDYVPCLIATIDLAEAGPGAVQQRSLAWAERRVPAVLASPADKVDHACVPPALASADRPDLHGQMRSLMQDRQVTVAVVGLRSLARRGGVLDDLSAAGFKISGPAWK